MTTINAQWCNAFNAALQAHFALTIQDAGLTDTALACYADQPRKLEAWSRLCPRALNS
ncbi:TPA: hypothetical protein ACKP7S_000457 [Stenotrophomonas maltophilia]